MNADHGSVWFYPVRDPLTRFRITPGPLVLVLTVSLLAGLVVSALMFLKLFARLVRRFTPARDEELLP